MSEVQEDKDLLIDFFSIPVKSKPKKKRKNKIVARVEAAGYGIERVGNTWEVWKKDDHGTTAIYDRLSDIPLEAPYV